MNTHEQLVLIGKSAALAGLLTEPAPAPTAAAEQPWLILLNAGILHKIGPNRMAVQLARLAAARGLNAFRFDFAGVGDSPARSDGRPLAEGVLVDIREVMSHLEQTRGARRFVVIGLCSGADNALRAAQADPRVVGVGMLDPSIRRTRRWYAEHFAPRFADPAVWRSLANFSHPRVAQAKRWLQRKPAEAALPADRPELFRTGYTDLAVMETHLREVLARKVQLFVAFSDGWRDYYNYRTQLYDVFPTVDFGDQLRLEFYPQAEHTFDLEAHRKLLLADLLDWVSSAPFQAS